MRENLASNSPFEPVIGFSRAVRAGDTIYVSGTVAYGDDGKIVGVDDYYAQARQAIANIAAVLAQAGASLADVVRTRMFVTSIDDWEEIGRAHGEVFGEVLPASTLVAVSGLVAPDMLVEIEADAVITRPSVV